MRSATRRCEGTFNFLEKSETRAVGLIVVALEALHFFKKPACAKGLRRPVYDSSSKKAFYEMADLN